MTDDKFDKNETLSESAISASEGWVKVPMVIAKRDDQSAESGAAVDVPEAPQPPPEPAWNDPKSYIEAPFTIEDGDEDIVLNSGAFQLNYTDIAFPGKNGFDFALARQYDSSSSNTEDINLNYDDDPAGRWTCIVYLARWQVNNPEMFVRVEDSYYFWYSKSAMLTDIKKNYSSEPVWHENDGTFENKRGYYEGYIRLENPWKAKIFMKSTKRPNEHFNKTYGLGYGWRFMLPSIERVQLQDSRMKYNTYLHLETGVTLPINEKNDGFTKYPLKDITIKRENNAYQVSYKDGRAAYFDAGCLLTRMTDRFGNQILFGYDGSGRMNQITDSFGRVILLELAGNALTVKRQDTGEALCTYVRENGELRSATDAVGRTTSYSYTQEKLQSQMTHVQSKDVPVDITYVKLDTVTHPTGAQTRYTYVAKYDTSATPYEGKHGYFVLASRSDIPNPASPAEVSRTRTFSYHSGEAKKTETDDTGMRIYGKMDWGAPYIDKATVMTHGGAVKEETTFKEDGFKETEATFHIVDGAEKRVEQHEYAFVDWLLTLRLDSYLNYSYTGINDTANIWQRINEYTYSADKKGDVLTAVVRYPARPSCDQETVCAYDANYSIPLEQRVLLDAGKYRIERYTLRAEPDGKGKVVERKKVYEKLDGAETLKERTEYEYDGSFRVVKQKCFYGAPLDTVATFIETDFAYENNRLVDEPVRSQMNGVKDITGAPVASPFGNGVIRTSFDYDWFGRVISRTDPNNHAVLTQYDGLGRVLRVTNADGSFKANVYDDAANKITVTDENGVSRRFEYTPLGKIAKGYILAPDTLLNEFRYDAQERLASELTYDSRAAVKATTTYEYDLYDMVVSKKIAGASIDMQETHTYNHAYARATVLEQIILLGDADAPNMMSYLLTDPAGRTVTEQRGKLVTEYAYDRVGNRTVEIDPMGRRTVWVYDYAGRVTGQLNPAGKTVRSEYDARGCKVRTKDYAGNWSRYTYDQANRLIETKSPFEDGVDAVTQLYYDAAGNLIQQKILCCKVSYEPGYNEDWKITRYLYDVRNRLSDTILDDNENVWEIRSRIVYDKVGNKLTQYAGMLGDSLDGAQKTAYTYDRFGNLLTLTDPLGGVEKYSYDATGRCLSKTGRDGKVTMYSYDVLDRVLSKQVLKETNIATVIYAYTRTGRKLREQSPTLTSTFKYDAMGRVIKISESDKILKEYAYNDNSNVVVFRMSRNGTRQMELFYIYDMLNRIVEVGSDNTTFVKYSYDANGNRSMLQYPASNLYVGYKYNNANLVILLENYAGADVSSYYQYSYYLDGNQSNKDTDLTSYTYDYDHMGRLIEDSCGDGNTIDYTYDRFSNRATMTVADMDEYTVEYDYDLNNRLLHEVKTNNDTSEVTTTTYTYDASGNQLTKTSVDGVETRTCNGFGQTMSTTVKGVQTIYAYRPDGLRYKKMVGAATTIHIWNGASVIADITNGAVSTKYLRGAGLATREAGGKREYYMFNAHGDVVRRMDTAGNAVKEYDYDAFGNENKPDAGDANVFRYCGEYFDKETGNVYLRARYYSPGIGRFGTQDPAMDGLNLYTYCGNNPASWLDPSGMYYIVANTNNTYTAHEDTWLTAGTRTAISFVPAGSAINMAGEAIFGVKGGSSATTGKDVLWDLVLMGLAKGGSKRISRTVSALSGGSTTISVVKTTDIVNTDKIVFDLFNRNDISTTSNSQSELDSMMLNSYDFVHANDDYFSVQYDGFNTIFEIDNKLEKASRPDVKIRSYANEYKNRLNKLNRYGGVNMTPGQINYAVDKYKRYLGGYKERKSRINSAFTSAVQ